MAIQGWSRRSLSVTASTRPRWRGRQGIGWNRCSYVLTTVTVHWLDGKRLYEPRNKVISAPRTLCTATHAMNMYTCFCVLTSHTVQRFSNTYPIHAPQWNGTRSMLPTIKTAVEWNHLATLQSKPNQWITHRAQLKKRKSGAGATSYRSRYICLWWTAACVEARETECSDIPSSRTDFTCVNSRSLNSRLWHTNSEFGLVLIENVNELHMDGKPEVSAKFVSNTSGCL